jgi:hypothetical protein
MSQTDCMPACQQQLASPAAGVSWQARGCKAGLQALPDVVSPMVLHRPSRSQPAALSTPGSKAMIKGAGRPAGQRRAAPAMLRARPWCTHVCMHTCSASLRRRARGCQSTLSPCTVHRSCGVWARLRAPPSGTQPTLTESAPRHMQLHQGMQGMQGCAKQSAVSIRGHLSAVRWVGGRSCMQGWLQPAQECPAGGAARLSLPPATQRLARCSGGPRT